jgi:hypothetical protein
VRRAAALGLAAALLVPGAAPRPAAAAVGERPPRIEAREWIGQSFEWKEKRGRVVVVVLLEPEGGAKAAAALASAANLVESESKTGLEAVLVTQAARADMEAFLAKQKTKARFTVAIDDGRALRSYFQTALSPYLAVVDRDGRIAFEGPYDDHVGFVNAVDAALARPREVPRLSTTPRFEPAWKAIEAGDTRAAIAALREVQRAPDLTPAEADDASALLAKIAIGARAALKAAKEREAEEEWYDATLAYDGVRDAYAGLSQADEAAAAAERIRGDKKLKKELEAGKTLRRARDLEAQGKAKEAAEQYRLVASRWKGTRAAERAKKRADELTKR